MYLTGELTEPFSGNRKALELQRERSIIITQPFVSKYAHMYIPSSSERGRSGLAVSSSGRLLHRNDNRINHESTHYHF